MLVNYRTSKHLDTLSFKGQDLNPYLHECTIWPDSGDGVKLDLELGFAPKKRELPLSFLFFQPAIELECNHPEFSGRYAITRVQLDMPLHGFIEVALEARKLPETPAL